MNRKRLLIKIFSRSILILFLLGFLLLFNYAEVEAVTIFIDLDFDVTPYNGGYLLENILLTLENNTADDRHIYTVYLYCYCDGSEVESKTYDVGDLILTSKQENGYLEIPLDDWYVSNPCDQIGVDFETDDESFPGEIFDLEKSIFYTVDSEPLDFGSFFSPNSDSTISLNPITNNYTVTSGAVTYVIAPQSAVLTIEGEGGTEFSINIDTTTATIYKGGVVGAAEMTVDNFVTNLTNNAGTTDNNGTTEVKIGADLNVNAGQVIGDYSGFFDVTVSYE
ncbi:MAG: DUF4402 domain-containing protein [Halanaerobiales bacterium]|nr:DUF4402 domain-containing protein [Halanaerobiales bacterium]